MYDHLKPIFFKLVIDLSIFSLSQYPLIEVSGRTFTIYGTEFLYRTESSLKGVYMFHKNYNVVVKRNKSMWWNNLRHLLADKVNITKLFSNFIKLGAFISTIKCKVF